MSSKISARLRMPPLSLLMGQNRERTAKENFFAPFSAGLLEILYFIINAVTDAFAVIR